MSVQKQYIGDGVYVDWDEGRMILTTENGYEATNTIVLEPEVWASLHTVVAAHYNESPEEKAMSRAEALYDL